MSEKGAYETFDSGSGPVIPKGDKDSYDNRDSNLHTMNEDGAEQQGQVPTVKSK